MRNRVWSMIALGWMIAAGLAGAAQEEKIDRDALRAAAARAIAAAREKAEKHPILRQAPTTATRAGEILKAELTLDKKVYDIGEPIIGMLTLRNVGKEPIEMATGGDYRSGREMRFKIEVTDERGKRLYDPLWLKVHSGLLGGLGSGVTIKPGEIWTHNVLLNKYTAPRERGRYRINGSYEYESYYDRLKNEDLKWPPVEFEISGKPTALNIAECARIFSLHDEIEYIHPCLFYGMIGDTAKIPTLLKIINAKQPDDQTRQSRADSNIKFYAMAALLLMPDKAAVYKALNEELGTWRQESEPDHDSDLYYALYQSAVTPECVELLEQSFDAPSEFGRRYAYSTALLMGSRKALERLPTALKHQDIRTMQEALQCAFLYLGYSGNIPNLKIPGLSNANAKEYSDTLMNGLRNEERVFPSQPGSEPDRYIWIYPLDFYFYERNRLNEALDLCVNSKAEVKHLAALRFLFLPGRNGLPALEKEAIARYLPFVRGQLSARKFSQCPMYAAKILTAWKDRGSIPEIEKLLEHEEKKVRLAAAESLILLRDDKFLERCLEVLTKDDDLKSPAAINDLASKMGLVYPSEAMQPEVTEEANRALSSHGGTEGAQIKENVTTSDLYLRELRKEILRQLYREK